MGKDSLLNNIFCLNKNKKEFVSYGKDKNKYFKIEKGDIKYINKKELDKGNPYIIFYIKKEEKENNQNYEEINKNLDLGSKEILNKGKNYKSNNKIKTEREKRIKNNEISNLDSSNNNKNKENNNNIKNKISKSTFDSEQINNNNDNNKIKNISLISHDSVNIPNEKNNVDINNNIDDGGDNGLIKLYFKFEDGKNIFIDVENYITFEKIIIKLKEKYEWFNIDIDNLYFHEKQIERNDIPKKLGIINGDYINVFSNLVDI